MTTSQQLQVVRFNASRSARGVSVQLHPGGPIWKVIVQTIAPESKEFAISKEVRTFSRVFILRSEIEDEEAEIKIGSTFINQVTDESYRVVSIDDNCADVRVAFDCETSKPV